MTYIKFEAPHLGDERWLEASPAAFVVHTWALSWCDEQSTDGRISTKRAHRLVCPAEPMDIPGAFAQLIELGWWRVAGQDYVYDGFLSHGIAAAEKESTRTKWAEDKRRRRLCNVGNHDLCGPRSRCKHAKSTGGSTTGQVDNQTRQDQNPKGSGHGGGEASAGDAAPTCIHCRLRNGNHTADCQAAT